MFEWLEPFQMESCAWCDYRNKPFSNKIFEINFNMIAL